MVISPKNRGMFVSYIPEERRLIMGKGKKTKEILDTPRRRRLGKEIGKDKLSELENLISEEAPSDKTIIETPARQRLRKEIGKEELKRIEDMILRGEL